jgi:hypothetical protein
MFDSEQIPIFLQTFPSHPKFSRDILPTANTVSRSWAAQWQTAKMTTGRDFADVELDLRDTLTELQAIREPALRLMLLRDMKLLLVEADELILRKDLAPTIRDAAR